MSFEHKVEEAIANIKKANYRIGSQLRSPDIDRLDEIEQERDELQKEEDELLMEWENSEEYQILTSELRANREELTRLEKYLEGKTA